ncbi:unnamed protein product [Durusdinium trenchii]|uniref:Uncharacterized protein n=1 Tax=Durusdinium trenchii TaxID=1381693 RepID=A0ABP0PG22_9DINO
MDAVNSMNWAARHVRISEGTQLLKSLLYEHQDQLVRAVVNAHVMDLMQNNRSKSMCQQCCNTKYYRGLRGSFPELDQRIKQLCSSWGLHYIASCPESKKCFPDQKSTFLYINPVWAPDAAECDGVESRGYVHSEVINEHPSELPDFDRRMWVVDPFYGWRTQDPEVDFDLRRKPLHLMPTSGWTPEVCKLPPDATTGAKLPDAPRRSGREAVGDGAEADAATEEPPTSAPARTWIQWLTGTSAPAPPSPPPPKPPLPSGRQMMPSKQDPVPDEPPQRPLPSWPELRQLLEPEMNAAGIAWEDVDDHLWNELLSVGELRNLRVVRGEGGQAGSRRRAVQRPKEFPDRLAQLSARVSNEDTVKIEALLSPSKRKKAQPQTPPQTLPPPRVPLPPQDSAPTSAVPAAPARLPPKQVPQEPEITAGGVADPLAKPVWTPQDDSAPAPEDLEQKPKKKKKDKSKKGKKEEDGCHVS